MQEVRKKIFSEQYRLNQELIDLAKQEKNHAFLTNPPILLIYTYLVAYIKRVAEEWFNHSDTLKILDWGSGKGHITFLLQEAYENSDTEVISCDVANSKLAHNDSSFLQNTPIIRERNIVVIPLEHAYKLPFSNNDFDIVISMGVLEHVPQDQNSLKEINRILKPSGLLFCFFLPYQWSWTQQLAHWRGNYYHDHLYGKRQVQRMLTAANFRLLDMWHRQLFPKNSVHYPLYSQVERLDQWLCRYTPLKYTATNVEFVATKI